jgi:hypothetical protein
MERQVPTQVDTSVVEEAVEKMVLVELAVLEVLVEVALGKLVELQQTMLLLALPTLVVAVEEVVVRLAPSLELPRQVVLDSLQSDTHTVHKLTTQHPASNGRVL